MAGCSGLPHGVVAWSQMARVLSIRNGRSVQLLKTIMSAETVERFQRLFRPDERITVRRELCRGALATARAWLLRRHEAEQDQADGAAGLCWLPPRGCRLVLAAPTRLQACAGCPHAAAGLCWLVLAPPTPSRRPPKDRQKSVRRAKPSHQVAKNDK
jgi:hypothetical protein